MELTTSRFGTIQVPEEKIIAFPYGLIGFEGEKSFVILKHKPESSFFWLQSLSTPELAFTLLFPFHFVPDYHPAFPESVHHLFQGVPVADLEIYGMVVIPKDPSKMTINLLSPVLVHSGTRKGMQVVLNDSAYEVNHPLVPAGGSASSVPDSARAG